MDLSASAYQTLFENDPEGLVGIDPDTARIRVCNERFCELIGRDCEELTGRKLGTLATTPQWANRDISENLQQEHAGDTTVEWQLQSDTAEESILVEVHLSSVPVNGEDIILARVMDIAERKNRLQSLERKSRAIETAPIGITISDPARDDNPLTYVNEEFQRLTGYSEDEVLGRNCRFLQGEETASEPVTEIRRAIDGDKPVTVELRNYRKGGTQFWNRVTIAPVRDDDGEVTNYIGFQENVTEWKRNQQELEHSHHLLETVPSGVLRTDTTPDGTFEYANPALVSLLGAESADQLREHCVADFYVDPEAREELLESLRDADDAPVKREVTLETLDGEHREVVITASLTADEMGTEHVHKVVQDITERKEREQALERYERLVETLPIGVYQNTPGPDGEFTFVNEAMVELFDADSKSDLHDHSVRDLYVDSVEREAFSEQLQEAGVVTERELELRTLRGETMWGAVTAITSEADGETVFDGVVQDITERKQYEQRLKEQRDNLDVLNQMLRHDIRNDLQLVTAYADFLADQVDSEGQEYVETIQDSAAHAVELTQTAGDMADVMLSTEDSRQSVNLRNRLDGELDEIRSEYSNAVITVEGSIPQVSVTADDMLDSVFRNLLTNAVNHNDKEIPEVQVSATERDETIAVRILDNGPGVPDDQKDAVFGKGEKGLESEGTGIGLYLVKTLVETYGGDVRVEDNEPHGAVFVVELPKAV